MEKRPPIKRLINLPTAPKRDPNWKPMKSVKLASNHYPMTFTNVPTYHLYSLEFEPPLERNSRGVKAKIFGLVMREFKNQVGACGQLGDNVYC
jgi:hypothetical protein